jgi:copper chaperone NosL
MKLYAVSLIFLFSLSLASCSSGPQPINYGSDACDFCKMNIVEEKFAAQCLNTKGKSFHFDDSYCMISFLKNGGLSQKDLGAVYLSDFDKSGNWIIADSAFLLHSDSIHTPMRGNTIAFSSDKDRTEAMGRYSGDKLLWKDINPFGIK